MPDVRPFRALRFSLPRTGNPAAVVAPPFNGLDDEALSALRSRSPFNVANLFGDGDGADRCATFREWAGDGVLQRDGEPALYAYEQTWAAPSGRRTRRGFFGLLGLRGGPRKVLLPYQPRSPGGPPGALRAFGADIEPVLALYDDPSGEVDAVLTSARSAFPDIALTDSEDVEHRLFPVTEPFALKRVAALLGHRTLLLGDAQRSYEDALSLHKAQVDAEASAEERPGDFVLTYFSNSTDPGLFVRPHHCVLEGFGGFEFTPFIKRIEQHFELHQLRSIRDVAGILDGLEAAGRQGTAFGLIGGGAVGRRSGFIARLDSDAARGRLDLIGGAPRHRGLDATVLNELILKDLLGLSIGLDGSAHGVDYLADAQTAMVRGRAKTTQLVILRNPPAVQALFSICQEGGHVARPAAHFYPHCLSGLLFNDATSF